MQQYLDKLNTIFNQLLKDHYNHPLWEEFGKIVNECYDNDIKFYYAMSYITDEKSYLVIAEPEVKQNAQMQRIIKEMEKLKLEKAKAVKMQSFDYAVKLREQDKELQTQLDRETAKEFYKTENYFYEVEARPCSCIGFNFTGNKVIDFLMEHYSKDKHGNTQLL